MLNDEDYIKWGKLIFKDALKVSEIQQKHLTFIYQIIEDITAKHNLSSDNLYDITGICFHSFTYTGTGNGPKELRDYWLNYIVNQNPWFDRKNSLEFSAIKILNSLSDRQILKEFNEFAHFYDNSEFKFILNKGQWANNNLNICVPFSLNYIQIEFAIRVIEQLTNHKVSKISLWYFTYDLSFDMYSEIYIALDDRIDKHEGNPFISKKRFLELEVESYKDWYKEVPEYSNYIKEIDDNTFQCLSCGDSIYDSGKTSLRCSVCNHYVDRDGNCISDDCESCEKHVSKENSLVNEDKRTYPECNKCGDSNDVSDLGGEYCWCSHCEHYIDEEGDCISEECETCEKDPFGAENGPFYLFFDTETTGVPKDWKSPITNFDNWPRIVQLAWLVYDRNGNQILKNEFIIKPGGFEIPIEASNIHGITTQYALENGVPLEDVLFQFEKHCEKSKYLIAHNINFDSKVIGSEYLRTLSRNPVSKLEKICTMESSTNFCKIPGSYGYKWPKLSELHIKLFGVDFEGAHDALADIEATAKCFWEMKKLELI